MVKPSSLEARLSALHSVSYAPGARETHNLLCKELGSRSSFVVTAAAKIVGEHELLDLAPLLVPAFERFLVNSAKSDPGCLAKLALVVAMERVALDARDLYLRTISYQQWEPVYGDPPQIETAGPIRGACGFGLVQLRHPEAMRELSILMNDQSPACRAQAIRGASISHEHEAAAVLLRFKALVGDEEPEIVRECLEGLLVVDRERAVPFVARFLVDVDSEQAESAGLVLGASRLGNALKVLKDWYLESIGTRVSGTALLAIATLRCDEAIDFLIRLVEEEQMPVASDALNALAIYAHDPRIWHRTNQATIGNPGLKTIFEAIFGNSH